jgi:hypothetical protein
MAVALSTQGYAYINYSTPEAAAAAVEHLNGIEFPLHSGNRIKVSTSTLGIPLTHSLHPKCAWW